MKLLIVAGARPNFMKVAPILEALAEKRAHCPGLAYALVHTGQHYDREMSQAFFEELGLPRPEFSLGAGSGTHAEQTGKVMIAFERLLLEYRPAWVVVVGDVNSTMACAITAKISGARVAHVEAGLRSGDWSMPEEVNRVVTDAVSDALFTTEPAACENLRREGVAPARIHFAGNVMIDTLLKHRPRAVELAYWERLGLVPRHYATVTLHRPSNVDDPAAFSAIVRALRAVSGRLAVAFPIHPRTRRNADDFGLLRAIGAIPNLHLLPPLGYLEMLSLNLCAAMVLTDSGGLQDEAAALGIPCITMRDNTERPITVQIGANRLVGNRACEIVRAVETVLDGTPARFAPPENWDGHAARRIVDILVPVQ